MDLRTTLNLPDAEFTIPMKADLPKLEPVMQKRWDDMAIYHHIQDQREGAPTFVLHDGPAYTNWPVHIGTALNKTLKDFVVKSRTMMGFRAPYVPGFDMHGLPIEQAAMKEFQERKETPSDTALRTACRAHAGKFVQVQTEQFKRLGVFGLWEEPYRTMDFRFEAEVVRVFKRLLEAGYIYKGLRPILWSPTSRTALADTEIVYSDVVSKAIYVRFPLVEDFNGFAKGLDNVYAVIWTTTPWTIPANLALAFHPMLEYAIVRIGADHYIVLASLVPKLAERLGWTDYETARTELGISFEKSKFKHPIFDRESLAVMGEYVNTEDGTGVVHTAPGHGRDDFYTGQKYHLPILCPVDERGVLTEEAGEFAGIYYQKCDTVVVDRLRELGALLGEEDYTHSYPHSERDGQPVIFRATDQWFLNLEHNVLRERMLEAIKGVKWVPASGQTRIEAMIANRPDWCLSRQRPWGVGVPIFYGATSGKPVMDPVAIECVAELVEREGSDAWFDADPATILPHAYVHPETGESEFVKEVDILDVWFDSGSSSLCVLEGAVDPVWKEKWPADLYLEGSDQHRGWFNSSLIVGTAVRDAAPYRAVLTHGFVTDEHGNTLSKRRGNAIDPIEVCDQYGADVLRYWVASVQFENDVVCSDALLKTFGEHYRSVRNTLRFLLGNLSDHDQKAEFASLEIDTWAMEQADLLVDDCVPAYENYQFGEVLGSIHNFCVNELSRFYLDAIKDRMYCDGKDWPSRKSGQHACLYVLHRLVSLLAPILVHTAEEVWDRIPLPASVRGKTIHATTFPRPSAERLAEIEASELQVRFSEMLAIRATTFAAFERWKAENDVKDSQDVVATIRETGKALEIARSFKPDELANYFKMSWVEIEDGESSVQFRQTGFLKCDRSRLRRPDVETISKPGDEMLNGKALSMRDRLALGLAGSTIS